MTTVINKRSDAPYDIYIGRPSKWGNPYSHLPGTLAKYKVSNRAEAIIAYTRWLHSQPELLVAIETELKDKVLACWCKPASCHGDVLAAIADRLP